MLHPSLARLKKKKRKKKSQILDQFVNFYLLLHSTGKKLLRYWEGGGGVWGRGSGAKPTFFFSHTERITLKLKWSTFLW